MSPFGRHRAGGFFPDVASVRARICLDPESEDPKDPGGTVRANLSPEQILDYFVRLFDNRTEEIDDECSSGTVNQCGQFMMNQFDQWLPATN